MTGHSSWRQSVDKSSVSDLLLTGDGNAIIRDVWIAVTGQQRIASIIAWAHMYVVENSCMNNIPTIGPMCSVQVDLLFYNVSR